MKHAFGNYSTREEEPTGANCDDDTFLDLKHAMMILKKVILTSSTIRKHRPGIDMSSIERGPAMNEIG